MTERKFSFGVFGDGPYFPEEQDRFERLLEDVRRSDIDWWIHIGDLLWNPCTDDALEERLAQLRSAAKPLVYTPGDNEWTDTHDERVGAHDPLDRLSGIRRIFFCNPSLEVRGEAVEVRCQSSDERFPEFCENARWEYGGFVFATVHVVGSNNGRAMFASRTAAHDEEVERRTTAAVQWIDDAFATAARGNARGLVLAMHANIGLERDGSRGDAFDRILEDLENNLLYYSKPVLVIHGDSHTHRTDNPFRDRSGRIMTNLTRLEAFGSPDIGWVRVVVAADGIKEIEPRLILEE
ncbi:MAG TPA: metallophosphoesterase [Gemmatimonadaceae bacterium]|nr:metallophosphoesterase [Gemmatimonadaceae bacterium]